jgi:putative proteasome-type protease
MTYCVAMLLDTGLVFLSDSRTSAGVDQISTFRKTSVFQRPGDRVLVVQTAGNLAITQAVTSMLREQIEDHPTKSRMTRQTIPPVDQDARCPGDPGAADERLSLFTAADMFEAARAVGDALREVHRRDAPALKDFGLEFNASIILGGQIKGEWPRLFSIYSAGNFIEATAETSYFQIGESKYGKPIIDRVLRRSSSLNEAAKCALVSMDSTIRSNLSVGLPADLVIIKRDRFEVARHMSIDSDNEYFRGIRNRWSEALREAFAQLPDPDWLRTPLP